MTAPRTLSRTLADRDTAIEELAALRAERDALREERDDLRSWVLNVACTDGGLAALLGPVRASSEGESGG
jgi:hypothetical protein